MISSFNLVKLSSLLKDFHMITRIRITVFNENFTELVAWPPEIAPFCRIIRSDPCAAEQCRLCDAHACETASNRHSPYIYQCHAGLTEAITPLHLGNVVIGYLLFGHVFSYQDYEEGWQVIEKLCGKYQIDRDALKNACLERPLITKEYILSASHIMEAVAARLCLERMAVLKQDELPVQIDRYIMKHFPEELSAADLCERFQIGKTSLYAIAKQSYGVGIAEHIRALRIEKAKTLLTERPDLCIGEIAAMCGFSDYNYFITVFKRNVGIPPKQFRKCPLPPPDGGPEV